ncbi:MAG: magnesium transporter [Myxococcaceae bacterium]|nr:magnesium transporter [Myxococcaceae bacterium]MBH2006352.1 magnesium transporter [Myxococcaceae bacterium]
MNEDLKTYLASLPHPADIKEYLEQSPVAEWPQLLRLIDDPDKRARVVAEIDEGNWQDLLTQLGPEEIANIIREMESDDAVDIIAKLPLNLRYETLYRLPNQERQQVLELLGYPEDSAGGIMQLELARVRADAPVSEAIQRVRELVEDDVQVLAVWVVDKSDCLVGSVELADLLIHKSTRLIKTLMDTDIICVRPLVDQKEVAELFQKYDLLTLPVVDDENHLIGRISVDDVVDVLTEEAEEEALRMAGTSVQELRHPEQVFSTARIRLPWLAVALGCSLVSASLLRFFQPLLEQMVVIYAFLPVIMAMGGNVGTQSSTILIRGLATGKSDLSDIPRMLYKEIRVGLIMGIFYGICAGLVATFLLSDFNHSLGILVFFSMVFAMITAAGLGVLAPALLKRLGVDPAIAAGPFVTTLNDITGILIYILISQLFKSFTV